MWFLAQCLESEKEGVITEGCIAEKMWVGFQVELGQLYMEYYQKDPEENHETQMIARNHGNIDSPFI